ncbi:hypothetical protein [Methanosphaerula subterraneus]|uniref:hypothetical protein n=1 Tax=Methanosphaerula subterraneus TaxID=3350244 RepID=UPI003F84B72D
MTSEKVTITTTTTKEELIDYIGHPCITNWKRHAKKEQEGTPVKNGGVCGKCMFRVFLEQYMVDNADGSVKIKNFMSEVRANPMMYPRISSLMKK